MSEQVTLFAFDEAGLTWSELPEVSKRGIEEILLVLLIQAIEGGRDEEQRQSNE